MLFKSLPLSLSLLASTVIAIPTPSELQSRAVIAHDAVVGFAEAVPSGTVGTVYEAYQPYLKVINGCVPFPAVDAAGNTGYDLFLFIFSSPDPLANILLFFLGIVLPLLESYKNRRLTSQSAGLATSGSSNGGCSSSTGQIYVRGAQSGSRYGLMYSWYHSLPPLLPTPTDTSPQVHAQRFSLRRARSPPRLGRRNHLALLRHLSNQHQHPSRLSLRSRRLGLCNQRLHTLGYRSPHQIRKCMACQPLMWSYEFEGWSTTVDCVGIADECCAKCVGDDGFWKRDCAVQ